MTLRNASWMQQGLLLSLFLTMLFSGCTDMNPAILEDALFGGDHTDIKLGKNIVFSRFTVSYDNNQDGVVNKGEGVYLRVHLKNAGTETATHVRALMTTTNSFVSDLYPVSSVGYGDISAGSEESGDYSYAPNGFYYSWRFTLSNTIPVGTPITFTIAVMDDRGNSWPLSFAVMVQATGAEIQYSRMTVAWDTNGDGIVNNGETIYLRVFLRNAGTSSAMGVTASMATTSSYISSLFPITSVSYGDINAGSEESGDYSYAPNGFYYSWKLTVSSTTPTGASIPFNLNITDGQGNTWTGNMPVAVQ